MEILAAGDDFVTSQMLHDAVRAVSPRAVIRRLDLPWPNVPFGPVAEVDEASGSEGEVIAALGGAQVLITQMAPVTRRVLESSPDLRLVVVCRGGPVNVNLEAARDLGVMVRTTPGRNAPAAAEHTIALMMAAMRNVPELDASMGSGQWRGSDYRYELCGDELASSTVGLVGYGAIGRRVAEILTAFGARLLVHDPYVTTVAHGSLVDLQTVLRESTVVSLHTRLTKETHHLVDEGFLARLRPGAVLVNTARGGLVDQSALVDALRSGHLRAAALDVYDPEPPAVDDPLRTAPRLVLTPHLAGATRQTALRAARLGAEAIAEETDRTASPV